MSILIIIQSVMVAVVQSVDHMIHNSPVVKLSVVLSRGPFASSKQWSLYTTTLNTHWVRVGRVVMS